jgi:hypothetical protein
MDEAAKMAKIPIDFQRADQWEKRQEKRAEKAVKAANDA